jgi:hypothetical protein
MFRSLLSFSAFAVAVLAAAPVPEPGTLSIECLSAPGKFLLHKGGQVILELPLSLHEAESAHWKKVPGVADPKGISFESVNRPGHFIRHANGRVYASRLANEGDRRDATWFVVKPLAAGEGCVSFETITHPGFFLVCQKDGIWIAKPEGDDFAQRATFRLAGAVPTDKLAAAEDRMRTLTRQMMDLEATARASVIKQEGGRITRRAPVNVVYNVEEFAPISIKFVRFVVLATSDGREPCIDELEIYGPDSKENLALASKGAKATASSLLTPHPEHQIEFLNDGRAGPGLGADRATGRGEGITRRLEPRRQWPQRHFRPPADRLPDRDIPRWGVLEDSHHRRGPHRAGQGTVAGPAAHPGGAGRGAEGHLSRGGGRVEASARGPLPVTG